MPQARFRVSCFNMACLKGCVNPELGKHHTKCPNYGRRCYPSGSPVDGGQSSPSDMDAAESAQDFPLRLQSQCEGVATGLDRTLPTTISDAMLSNDTLAPRSEQQVEQDICFSGREQSSSPDFDVDSMCDEEDSSNVENTMVDNGEAMLTHADRSADLPLGSGVQPKLATETRCRPEELRASTGSSEEIVHARGTEPNWDSEMMCCGTDLDAAPDVKADRRVRGAAATLGAVAGVLVSGPFAGVAMAAVAAHVITRENDVGCVIRKASTAYLQVTDEAVHRSLQVADQVFDEGCKQLAKQLDNVNHVSAPVPVRAGIQKLSQGLKSAVEPPVAAAGQGELEEARRMLERFPDRVPVICSRSAYSDLPPISKKKFAVPGNMLCSEFKYMLHKHVVQAMPVRQYAEQTIYIFVNGITPKTSTPMSDLYAQLGPDAGFLHVNYSAENTLG